MLRYYKETFLPDRQAMIETSDHFIVIDYELDHLKISDKSTFRSNRSRGKYFNQWKEIPASEGYLIRKVKARYRELMSKLSIGELLPGPTS